MRHGEKEFATTADVVVPCCGIDGGGCYEGAGGGVDRVGVFV